MSMFTSNELKPLISQSQMLIFGTLQLMDFDRRALYSTVVVNTLIYRLDYVLLH